MPRYGAKIQGTAALAAVGTGNILAAVDTSTAIFVNKIIISVYVHQDTGIVYIGNGTTTYWQILAKDDNGVSWTLDFGEDGLYIGKNTNLILGVVTANVSVIATAIGYKRGNA